MIHAACLEARSTAFRDHRRQDLLLVSLQGGIYSVSGNSVLLAFCPEFELISSSVSSPLTGYYSLLFNKSLRSANGLWLADDLCSSPDVTVPDFVSSTNLMCSLS
jgi:hypothetical protein